MDRSIRTSEVYGYIVYRLTGNSVMEDCGRMRELRHLDWPQTSSSRPSLVAGFEGALLCVR